MKSTAKTFTLDELENAVDSVATACSFLDREDPFKWKWFAFAIHHSLYSLCVTSLCMCRPDYVLIPRNPKGKIDGGMLCQFGNGPWMKSRRETVGQGPAYRIKWELSGKSLSSNIGNNIPETHIDRINRFEKMKLIGFWTALARIQDPYFWMGRRSNTKAIELTDEEMLHLVWLNDHVRNDLMHFMPKVLTIHVSGVITSTLTALKAIHSLAFESYTIPWPPNVNLYELSKATVAKAIEKLNVEQLKIQQTSVCSQ